MRTQIGLYPLMFSLLLLSASSVHAMHFLNDYTQHLPDKELAIQAVTCAASTGLGYCVETSSLPAKIKVPLFGGLLLANLYGSKYYERSYTPPDSIARVLRILSTATALTGMTYNLKKVTLPAEYRGPTFLKLFYISLRRLCKSESDQ